MPIDPAIDAAVSGVTGAAPQKPTIATPADAVAQVLGQDNAVMQTTLRSNLQATTGMNPDAEAKVNHLSRFLNVPADAVRADPNAVKATAAQQLFSPAQLAQDSPQTAALLSQQANMNALHDDIPSVAAVESAVKGLAAANPRGVIADMGSAALSTADKIHQLGIRTQLALQPYLPQWLKSSPDQLAEAMQSGGEAFDAAKAEAPTTIPGQIVGGALYAVAGPLAPPLVAATEGVNTEQELLSQGADPDAARLAAAAEGGLQGLMQYVPMGKVIFNQGVKKGLTSVAAAAAKSFAVGADQSGLSGNFTASILDGVGQTDLADQYRPTLEGLAQGGAFMAGIHLAGAGMHAAFDRNGNPTPQAEQANAQQTNASSTILQKLGESSAAGKFRERDPEGFHQFVSDVSDANSAPELYVDARTFSQALDESGVTGEALSAQLPDVAGQMREALQTEGQVRISLADYSTHIAGGPVDGFLQPHLRTAPDGMTFAEAKAHAGEQMADAAPADGEAAPIDQNTTELQGVHDTILDQLNATGRYPADVSKAYAALTRDFYGATAERTGQSPAELFAAHPLSVKADSTPGEQLDQSARGNYSPDTNTITALHDADLSTYLHELGHHFLETYSRIASERGAPEGITNDVKALLGPGVSPADWLAKPLDERRDAHENFARSFEAYLMEGKAPSTELQPLFSRFRSWLVQVYKSLTALKVILGGIRGNFSLGGKFQNCELQWDGNFFGPITTGLGGSVPCFEFDECAFNTTGGDPISNPPSLGYFILRRCYVSGVFHEYYDSRSAGVWTPIITGSSGSNMQGTGGFTYSLQVGRFYRIGNVVTAIGDIQLTGKDAGSTGDLQIGGLPVLPLASMTPGAGSLGLLTGFTYTTGYTQIELLGNAGLSVISVRQSGASGSITVPISAASTALRIAFVITYLAA